MALQREHKSAGSSVELMANKRDKVAVFLKVISTDLMKEYMCAWERG